MNFTLFVTIYDWVNDQIDRFTETLSGHAMTWVGAMAYVLVTLWVLFTGYRVLTGTLREPLMAVVVRMARVVVIMAAATSASFFGSALSQFFNHDLGDSINQLVTGSSDGLAESIDKNLAAAEVAMGVVDALQLSTGDAADPSTASDKFMTKYLAVFGSSGPALTAAAMLLMYRFAMALVIGLGPIFILCLLFDQTKALFQRWLLYGIGTLFSMAVLNFVTALVMKLSVAIAGALWTMDLFSSFLPKDQQGLTHVSIEQGGIGLILTTLIITTPPMAANFFQGTLGNFMHYSAFGGSGLNQWKAANGMPSSPQQPQSQAPTHSKHMQ
jgi:type IV secretion system protein VirB6